MAGDNFHEIRLALQRYDDEVAACPKSGSLGEKREWRQQVRALIEAFGDFDPDLIRALLAERDALQAKVEAMEKDAGRLDWLESERGNLATEWTVTAIGPGGSTFNGWFVNGSPDLYPTAREAIDASIKLAQPTGEKP